MESEPINQTNTINEINPLNLKETMNPPADKMNQKEDTLNNNTSIPENKLIIEALIEPENTNNNLNFENITSLKRKADEILENDQEEEVDKLRKIQKIE